MIRKFISTCLVFTSFYSFAQNGYIKFHEDSTLFGYLKFYTSAKDREQLIEFWKTKKDKAPMRFHKREIVEYSINKDTFLILKNFRPFDSEEVFIEIIEAKIIRSGKIELLRFDNPYYRSGYPLGGLAGAAISISINLLNQSLENTPKIFVLRESRNNYMRGVPEKDEMFKEVIMDFFPEKAIESFEKDNGKIKFSSLKKLVTFYNARTSKK